MEAKYRLQLALVLTVFEKFETDTRAKAKLAEETAKAWKATDQDALDEYSCYELAQFHAVTGKDSQTVAKQVQIAMDQRPKARARNLLRKWIRSEPFFQRFLEEPNWKPFITDEPVPQPNDFPKKKSKDEG